MTDTELLSTAERLLSSFEARLSMSTEELLQAVSEDETLLSRCLAFLKDRDHLLIAAGAPTLFHRDNVVASVLRCVSGHGPVSPTDVSRKVDVPVAIVCEALGWLEREGRVLGSEEQGTLTFTAR